MGAPVSVSSVRVAEPHDAATQHLQACEVEVAVLGGGLSGSVAAVTLARAGYSVALIDRYATFPPQFRVEKFGGEQADAFRRLGLLEAIAAVATPFDTVVNVHRGKLLDRTRSPYYAIRYQDLVQTIRGQLPASVRFIAGEVADVRNGGEHQTVVLRGGQTIVARLVVVATGMPSARWDELGVVRRATFENHSITFGFDLAPAGGGRLRHPALTYYGHGEANGIDYLTTFPVGQATRANLFTFLSDRDPWLGRFLRSPDAVLRETLPGLASFLGDFRVVGPVQPWIMSLFEVDGYELDGVVFVGDAFRTNCPAAGIGVSRLLTDIERLCSYAPGWLAGPGMGWDKIRDFYADEVKRASDQRALSLSRGRRSMALDNSLPWRLRRHQQFLRRRVAEWFRQQAQPRSLQPAG